MADQTKGGDLHLPTLEPIAKLGLTVAWLFVSGLPALALLALGIDLRASSGADASVVVLPLLWCLCAGLTSPIYARILGHVQVIPTLPPVGSEHHHLPAACVRLVEEAAAIRGDVEDLDRALARAWALTQATEAASPHVRAILEASGATLDPVHELLDAYTRARSRRANAQIGQRLAAVLAKFEDALTQPDTRGFR